MAVVAQGEGGHGQAGGFCQGCEAGEGPVDGEGDQVGDELLGAGRQAADQQAVALGAIEVEQQRRAGFEQRGAGADGGGGIGHVVEHAESHGDLDWNGLRSEPRGRSAGTSCLGHVGQKVGPWRGVAQELQPSDEWLVFEQESDQASELSGVFWCGVELVLELHNSASSLELSSSSRFSLCSIAYLCTFSSTVGCQLSFANSCRHGGSEERNACLLR